jgi:hypothetical protein
MQMANELVGWRHFFNWRLKLFLEAKIEEVVLEVDEFWRRLFIYTHTNWDSC